jgi:hypothetical protein
MKKRKVGFKSWGIWQLCMGTDQGLGCENRMNNYIIKPIGNEFIFYAE